MVSNDIDHLSRVVSLEQNLDVFVSGNGLFFYVNDSDTSHK
jgi:hypothetical protein